MASPRFNFDIHSSYFNSGSFPIFSDNDVWERPFYNDLQLKWESADVALRGLLAFLDERFPGASFFNSNAARMARIASLWLGKAGRHLWNERHTHLAVSEEDEGDELEWPYDKEELVYGIRGLLLLLKPIARRFYEARVFYRVASGKTVPSEPQPRLSKREREDDEDDDIIRAAEEHHGANKRNRDDDDEDENDGERAQVEHPAKKMKTFEVAFRSK